MNRRWTERRGARDERGQSMVELALCLPILCFLLLGVVDFARAYSVEKRLEQGTHLATLPSSTVYYDSSDSAAADYIATQAGLPSSDVTATKTYSVDANGNNHVTITAGYGYPLLLPGLRGVQVGGITNGKLAIGVQATGNAPTDPPTIVQDAAPTTHCSSTSTICLRITPATGAATPSGLASLVCTVFWQAADGTLSPKALIQDCSATNPLYYDASPGTPNNVPHGQKVTATIAQADGVVSQPSSAWTAP